MMKNITILSQIDTVIHGDSIDNGPVGGADTALINLTKLWAKMGHKVDLYVGCNYPGYYDGVTYHDIRNDRYGGIDRSNTDILIINRNMKIIESFHPKNFGIKKVLLYCHDLPSDPFFNGIHKYLNRIDRVICVSEWHKKNLMKVRVIPEYQTLSTRNGINLDLFNKKIKKIPGKCVFSSTPYKGLNVMLGLWPRIKKVIPHAELYIFSSMKTYGAHYDDREYQAMYDLAEKMDGVHYMGSQPQQVLADHLMQAEAWLYPNIFPETSCITAMEAQAAGAVPITSKSAALQETVKSGILISGNPFTEAYRKEFISAVTVLLTDHIYREELSKKCQSYDWSWKAVAEAWNRDLFVPECFPDKIDLTK